MVLNRAKRHKLLHELEIEVHSLPMIGYDSNSVAILDFLTIVQYTIQKNTETFGQLLQSLKSSVIPSFQENNTIALVPDRYDIEQSIKREKDQGDKEALAQKFIFVTLSTKPWKPEEQN